MIRPQWNQSLAVQYAQARATPLTVREALALVARNNEISPYTAGLLSGLTKEFLTKVLKLPKPN